jgi:DNA repair exonuclease SbcCD nuclease subunit
MKGIQTTSMKEDYTQNQTTNDTVLERKTEFNYNDKYNDEYNVNKESYGAGISVLTIGDPHFRIDNLDDISVYISRIESLVKNEKPNFVVILGDLLHCHERIHTTVLNKAYTFINRLRKYTPVYILVGNHDYINNSQFLSDNHWMNAMKHWENVFVVDKGIVYNTQFGKFIFCPYVFRGKFIEALNIIDPNDGWKNARSIFCHQEFYRAKMGSIISEVGDKWDLDYPLIISGHVHDKQHLQNNIFYTGSSIQHAFGESHDKTIALCHFGNNILVESVDLNLPRKKILYMDIDKISSFVQPKDTNDKIRITLSGNYEEYKVFRKSKKYKELIKKNIKIVFRGPRANDEIKGDSVVNENFYDILFNLVQNEKNTNMIQLYNEIISN